MEITLEKIELVKDRTGVTYAEAKKALEDAGVPIAEGEVTMIPQNYVTVTEDGARGNIRRILDLLDECDDVQYVYHNWDEEE